MVEEKVGSVTSQGSIVSSEMVLDATDDSIAIEWTNGNSNGSSLDGYEVYVATYRGHKQKYVAAAAREQMSCEINGIKLDPNEEDPAEYRLTWENITDKGQVIYHH